MSITEFFIRRPITSILLSLALLVLGAVSFIQLPVAPLPSVDFPAINVSAKLPGADPDTMAATVAAPLERRLGVIPGVSELTSTSSEGSANVMLIFDLSRNIEGAARDVQQAITTSRGDLPADLPTPPTYRKLNPSDAPILILAVTSDTLAPTALYDAADSILSPRISQISGVGQVSVNGADKPAVRVQMNPVALLNAGLSAEDVRTAINKTNVNVPKGSLNGSGQSIAIGVNDQMLTAKDYQNLVLKTGNGTVVRLSDVAHVSDSVENNRQAGWFNDTKAVLLIISKQPNANVIETVDHIKTMLPQLQEWMPTGSTIHVVMDRTQTIRAGVQDVEMTLLISTALVVLVVWFSLGRLTPTLAATITVPLALSATFFVMWLVGFSLNNISLMALTICVGFVIDDAIVMIENIAHYVEKGMSPVEAAIKGSREIVFTVISISLSLVAVFIPLLFMGGIIGRVFQEFAVTLSAAVMVSVVVSITITPSVYAMIMQWHHSRGSYRGHKTHMGERLFDAIQRRYERALHGALKHQRLMLLLMMATIVATIFLYIHVPKGFLPQQDTGLIMGNTEARSDISFTALRDKQQVVNHIILQDPAVAGLASFVGNSGGGPGGGNGGRVFISLKPMNERHDKADAVINRLRPKLAEVDGLATYLQAAQDVRVGGRSSKAQYQFTLTSDSLDELREWTPKLMDALRKEPGITDLTTDQDAATQQVNIVVDRDRASQLGVSMQAIDQILQDAFAQRQVSIIYKARNQYHVVLEFLPSYTQDASALEHIYIKSKSGAHVRLNEIAHFENGFAALSVQHQGQFPAATITFNLGEGASLGAVTDQVKTVAASIMMPDTIHYAFGGNAAAMADSTKDMPILILSAFLAIYLVLGILYENTYHPLTIISTLPSAGLGALIALWVTHTDLSIISIIGVVLLMGIVKKNGIMLVDFAIIAERNGMTPAAAIEEACRRRFRPILMTTLASLLGAVPLAVGFGNASEFRQPLGIAIVGGLLVSQVLTLFTTPVVYLALDKIANRRKKLGRMAYAPE